MNVEIERALKLNKKYIGSIALRYSLCDEKLSHLKRNSSKNTIAINTVPASPVSLENEQSRNIAASYKSILTHPTLLSDEQQHP